MKHKPASKKATPPPPPVVRTLPSRTLAELCAMKSFVQAVEAGRTAEEAARHCGYTLISEEATP